MLLHTQEVSWWNGSRRNLKESSLSESQAVKFLSSLRVPSLLIAPPSPRVSASLSLAGLPEPALTLSTSWSLVCLPTSSSSAFLLPFPLPLAGVRAEWRSQGADPAAAGGTERGKQLEWEGWRDDKLKEHLEILKSAVHFVFEACSGLLIQTILKLAFYSWWDFQLFLAWWVFPLLSLSLLSLLPRCLHQPENKIEKLGVIDEKSEPFQYSCWI